jgi:16S rRNA (cytidine1402-2'-O)-methyltransferase
VEAAIMVDKVNSGTLYIVGTPIGNLGDFSERGKQVLSKVSMIAAEDTRHTARLLAKFNIKASMTSCHEHNSRQKTEEIIERLANGGDVALVTDAGMPVVSDPGSDVVSKIAEKGFNICLIPGPSAATTALAASGFPGDKFVFEGFLPSGGKARRDNLTELAEEKRTMVFYEAPHRVKKILGEFSNIFGGDRRIVIAREMTKIHEEYIRLTVKAAILKYENETPKGEFVLVVEGRPKDNKKEDFIDLIENSTEIIKKSVIDYVTKGIDPKAAISLVAKERGIRKRDVYSAYHNI